MLQNVDHKAKFRSKKGQLPFVELNGEEIADSSFIIKELSDKFGKDLDAGKLPAFGINPLIRYDVNRKE